MERFPFISAVNCEHARRLGMIEDRGNIPCEMQSPLSQFDNRKYDNNRKKCQPTLVERNESLLCNQGNFNIFRKLCKLHVRASQYVDESECNFSFLITKGIFARMKKKSFSIVPSADMFARK